MVAGIILALLAGCGFACGAALFATVVRRGLPFMAFLGLGASLGLMLALALEVRWAELPGATRSGELGTWIILGALANVAGHRAIARAMAGGNGPVSWAISQGGQAVPFVMAVVIWGDVAHPVAWVGLGAVLFGVAALARGKGPSTAHASRAWVGWALAALACYGLNGSLMSVPSRWDGWHDTAHLRLPLTLGVFALCGMLATRGWNRALVRRLLPLALPYGAVLVGCFLSLYLALDHLTAVGAAAIAWPMACGSGIALFALWERIALRHSTSWADRLGISLVVVGIAALAVRPS